MNLKLKIEWPGSNKKQIVISQRLASDPYGDNGFYVAMQGESIIVGTGGHGSNEAVMQNAMPAEAWLELDPNCICWRWSDDPNDIIGLMFFTPIGDTLYVGEDPQMPGAKFEGTIQIETTTNT